MTDTAATILSDTRTGRKPGTPKTGGRPKGRVNKLTADAKDIIAKRGRPVEFLADVCRGMKIRVGPQAGPGVPEYIYPSLEQRLAAAKILIGRLVPEMKAVELANNPDNPLTNPAADDGLPVHLSIARKVAFLLAAGTPPDPVEPRRAAADDPAAQDFRAALHRPAAAPAAPAAPPPLEPDGPPRFRELGAMYQISEGVEVSYQGKSVNGLESWAVIRRGEVKSTHEGLEVAAAAARGDR